MLSVWLERNGNGDNNSIEAVATIEGCEALGTNLMWEKDYAALNLDGRIAYVEDRVRSLAEKMAVTCKTKLAEPVQLRPLDRLFSN